MRDAGGGAEMVQKIGARMVQQLCVMADCWRGGTWEKLCCGYVCHFAVAKDCRFPLVGAESGLAESAKFPEEKTMELRLLTDEIFAQKQLFLKEYM